jgi:hypothetical protein
LEAPQSSYVKIHGVNGLHAFFTTYAGEIVLVVLFGLRLIFSRKKLGFRLFIFGILFVLLYFLNRVDVQDINPFGGLDISTNMITGFFLLAYALYILFFDHD